MTSSSSDSAGAAASLTASDEKVFNTNVFTWMKPRIRSTATYLYQTYRKILAFKNCSCYCVVISLIFTRMIL